MKLSAVTKLGDDEQEYQIYLSAISTYTRCCGPAVKHLL
jgi:hypothetical protein